MKQLNPIKSTFIKRSNARSAGAQRGGILIESIIGLLILGIVGGGIMHSTARMTVAQRDMAAHTVAINQMRNVLMSGVTAAGSSPCTTAPTVSLPGDNQPKTVTVSGCAPMLMKISGVKIDGTALIPQDVSAAGPLVFELGEDDDLVRIGGKMNEANGGS